MKPYYERDGITIYNEDALETVSMLGEFDYIITDPPYPTGGESSMQSAKSIKDTREMIDGLSQSLIMGVIRRIKKRSPFVIWMFVDWRQVSFYSSLFRGLGWHNQSCVVWDKMVGSRSARYFPSHELILCASDSASPKPYLGRDVIQMNRTNPSVKTHPFEKPHGLVVPLCKEYPIGKAIDPFFGTGGLLVGANQLGWDVTGIDISKEFCEIAAKRLGQEVMDLRESGST